MCVCVGVCVGVFMCACMFDKIGKTALRGRRQTAASNATNRLTTCNSM